ncbi:MAG: Ammonium transporter [uncultured Phycisphaerae bacterium]|uniref:Ammonium transporter n=1 Tax=uncultured Phycisphaerae bacterium TaxID=904963 RepID=A0A6J4PCU4_9BACT|nr:MAG: Ammonium transporter [uncultured Phycisphaerae bacterium]
MVELLIVLGAAALLVRVGQALYATGLGRSKNAAGAATRSLFDLCAAALAFWAVGAAILFQQHNPVFALKGSLVLGWRVAPDAAGVVFFHAAAVLIASGVLAGTLAERSRFFPAAAASVLLAGLVVPLAGNWAWAGWLRRLGFIDLAGASVIHLAAGAAAFVGAMLVGPRNGKYHRDGSASNIPGHNLPLAAAGAFVMLPGWVAYVLGFALVADGPLGVVALNVLLAAAAGGLAALLLGRFRYGKPDPALALLGFLGGLVAITAGAAHVRPPSAFLIGAVAGVLVPLAAVALDLFMHVDDPAGGISVHAVGGLWGTFAAGLFAPGYFAERLQQAGIQLLGATAICALAAAAAFALFYALRQTVGLRAREADEFDGLDLAEHDIGAYPDFQQTTIKSYHLREA